MSELAYSRAALDSKLGPPNIPNYLFKIVLVNSPLLSNICITLSLIANVSSTPEKSSSVTNVLTRLNRMNEIVNHMQAKYHRTKFQYDQCKLKTNSKEQLTAYMEMKHTNNQLM